MSQTNSGYHVVGQILVVIFDSKDICISQFRMITTSDWS